MCHAYSAGLPTQYLIELQPRDRLRIRTHRGRPLVIRGFRCQVCRLVKLKLGEPQLLLEQSAAVHSPPPVVSALVRLPVQLLARRPRLQILKHHLIRRTPFRPPAYIHRSPLQFAITACVCPRHTTSAAHPPSPPPSGQRSRESTAATCLKMFCYGPPAPHDGIKNGVPQTRPEQEGRGGTGKKTERIRVEIELTQEHMNMEFAAASAEL